jgi:hypothetical protein
MTTNPLTSLTLRELKDAVVLRERIDALRDELDQLVSVTPSLRIAGNRTKAKRLTMVRDGNQRRSKRRKLSRAARARLSAMAKARWAKAKASGRSRL